MHLDTTYLSRNEGVLCALDSHTGEPLHLEFVKSETTWAYDNAIKSIESRGYKVQGIIMDGHKSLFDL